MSNGIVSHIGSLSPMSTHSMSHIDHSLIQCKSMDECDKKMVNSGVRPRKLGHFSLRHHVSAGLAAAVVLFVVMTSLFAYAQNEYPPPSACPVQPELATAKLATDMGEKIVVWFSNRSTKTLHGVQFQFFMLDAAGNRYPASQMYEATGAVKVGRGDLVIYPTQSEAEYFGKSWSVIDGIEVRVVSVMFEDASTWRPRKAVICRSSFLNEHYLTAVERWQATLYKRNQRHHQDDEVEHPPQHK
jgi:hypothetical protein